MPTLIDSKKMPLDNVSAFEEMSLAELSRILDSTIVCDDINKCIVFLAMLATYTASDQLTICLLGQSSSGKTYLAQEIAKYFPREDVYQYADVSPTAFKYSKGEIKEDGKNHVNLIRKILLFTEMPHPQLLANLRPILSHDSEKSEYMTTDVGSGGSRKARSTVIDGFPTVIFCSSSTRLDEQEATRAILLSPETSHKKIIGATALSFQQKANPKEYEQSLNNNQSRNLLKQRIEYIKSLEISSVIIPNPEKVISKFNDITENLAPRNTRDISHVASLIKAVAMLNANLRMDKNKNVVVNDNDIDEGLRLWGSIAETQGYGITPAAKEFYNTYILPAYKAKTNSIAPAVGEDGITIADITKYCQKINGKLPINLFTIQKEILPALEYSGLLAKSTSASDHRKKLFKPLVQSVSPENYTKKPNTEAPKGDFPKTVSPNQLEHGGNGFRLTN